MPAVMLRASTILGEFEEAQSELVEGRCPNRRKGRDGGERFA